MAKSIISLLTGIAIREGKIKSVNEPVGNYLPEFKAGLAAKLKIKDLVWIVGNRGNDLVECRVAYGGMGA